MQRLGNKVQAWPVYRALSVHEVTSNLMEGFMWRMLLIALLLAGCVQLPPSPAELQSKKFENLPDKSVIYVVRTSMDSSELSGLALDGSAQITTYRGTYYRWEVAPGTHRVAGMMSAHESVTLTTAPGKIYFLEHTVLGTPRSGPQSTWIRVISEQDGRALVMRSQLLM